jgi:hypothetical protein
LHCLLSGVKKTCRHIHLMGLFSISGGQGETQSLHKSAKPTADGAYEAPGRRSRVQCWDARDGFNACLDRNNILDAIKEKEKADSVCGKESQEFEKNCATSWVSAFLNTCKQKPVSA